MRISSLSIMKFYLEKPDQKYTDCKSMFGFHTSMLTHCKHSFYLWRWCECRSSFSEEFGSPNHNSHYKHSNIVPVGMRSRFHKLNFNHNLIEEFCYNRCTNSVTVIDESDILNSLRLLLIKNSKITLNSFCSLPICFKRNRYYVIRKKSL